MGWDFFHAEPGERTGDIIARELGSDLEIVAQGMAGTTWYGAVSRNNEVHGVVVLTQRRPKDYYNFGYKFMDEEMGPYESEAPAKVLDALTPTDNEYALEWRRRCQKNLERKNRNSALKVGQKVVFAKPITFSNNLEADTFVYCGKNIFHCSFGRVRIPGWKKYSFTISS